MELVEKNVRRGVICDRRAPARVKGKAYKVAVGEYIYRNR